MESGPDQSNELSMLNGDDDSVSPDSQDIWKDWLYNQSILIVQYLDNISHTPQKYRATITIFISF